MAKTIEVPVWVETLRFRVIICCAVTIGTILMIAALATVTGTNAGERIPRKAESSSALPTRSYEGMITDTRCGAKHSAALGLAAADCTRSCVHGGEQFALVDGENVYLLDGETAALKKMAGQRVRIAGALNGNRISVSAVGPGV